MRRFNLIVLSLLSAAMLVSCDKLEDIFGTEENPDKPQIEINTPEILSATDGDSSTIMFSATENWTAEILNSRSDGWCSIYPTSGNAGEATITVTTQPNDTPDERSASIIIKAGSVSKTVKVSQKQKDAIIVAKEQYSIGSKGGQIVIEAESNIDFDVVISNDWIKQITTRSLQSKSYTFEILQNTDKKDRQGFVKFVSQDETISQTVYINQSCANGNTEDIENGDTNEW